MVDMKLKLFKIVIDWENNENGDGNQVNIDSSYNIHYPVYLNFRHNW